MSATPPCDRDLPYLTATNALALFRARRLSPVELLEALARRSEAVEPTVNAFADCYWEEAFERARKAEARYAKDRARPRSLEGLALAVKDDTAIEGRRTTKGSLIHKDHVDDFTNPSIERLLRAGTIVHARTTCPVLAVPSGIAGNGVPTGVQIVGRSFDDVTVFRVGATLERERPWFDTRTHAPPLAES